MKLLRNLIPAAALMAFASSVPALAAVSVPSETIHIAGSTAYRSAVNNAIANLMTHTGSPTTYGQAAYIGTNLAGANIATFVGTISNVNGGNPVAVEVYWSGSFSGQADLLSNPTTIPWISPSVVPTSGANAVPGGQSGFITNFGLSPGVGGGSQLASSGNPTSGQLAPAAIADFALSDAFQTSGPFKANSVLLAGVTSGGALEPASGNGTGKGEEVGIIPFVWVKGAANSGDTDYGTWKNILNITSLQAQQLLSANNVPASYLTGVPGDSGVTLYVTGRDGDSGTRLDALAESDFGIFSTTDQYTFAVTAAMDGSSDVAGATMTSNDVDQTYALAPNTVPTNNVGGYNSGGSMAKAMAASGEDAALSGYIIGYLGVADADTLLSPNGKADGSTGNPTLPSGYVNGADIEFNGVSLSNPSNHADTTYGLNRINQGAYSFWTYEHFFARPTTETVPGGQQTYTSVPDLLVVAGKVVSDLESTDANVAGYRTSQVTSASRTVEGGVISP